MISWIFAVREAVKRQSLKSTIITNKNLVKFELPTIVKKTGSKGKTPKNSLSYYLQKLRDCGEIQFLGRGKYKILSKECKSTKDDEFENLPPLPPTPTECSDYPKLNIPLPSIPQKNQKSKIFKEIYNEVLGYGWNSQSRNIGETGELYIHRNFKCQRCGSFKSKKHKANKKSRDVECSGCRQQYQVKTIRVGEKKLSDIRNFVSFSTMGAAYKTTFASILKNYIDYFIVLYDKETMNIKGKIYAKHEDMSEKNIIASKPLKPTAIRAGWQGCRLIFEKFRMI